MKTNKILITAIIVLAAVLVLLLVLVFRIDNTNNGNNSTSSPGTTLPPVSTTVPSTNATENKPTQSPTTQPPTTQPPTTQPPTTQPPTTQPPTTQPTQTETTPTEPLVGLGIYTREELEKLPTTEYGYGPGKTSGGARAPYAESDQKKYSKYAANFIAPDNGNIYLTFDCGYEYTATDANGNTYRVTERILDILKEKNVKAVFFVTLHYCQTSPDLVQRMVDEGHAIGNHSKTHPVMPQLSIDQMIYQVTYMHDYILEHFGYEMHLFRPPTGAYSVQSLAVVQNLGYKNVHWSFAYLDYDTSKQPGYDYALNMVTGSHHSGAIYLLHAVSTTNADILGEAIDFFLAQGYNLELFN